MVRRASGGAMVRHASGRAMVRHASGRAMVRNASGSAMVRNAPDDSEDIKLMLQGGDVKGPFGYPSNGISRKFCDGSINGPTDYLQRFGSMLRSDAEEKTSS